MDDLTKTLSDLETKAINFSKSDRQAALEFLKKLINNLENVADETLDEIKDGEQESDKNLIQKIESCKDSRHKSPLKLTIRKFKSVETNVVCHECHKTFITMKKMISHVLNSHTKAELTCRLCKGTFYCYNLFIIHECINQAQTVFVHRQCGICDKLFLQKKEYHLHMADEHMITLDRISKTFQCNLCQIGFQLRSQLLVHSSQFHKDMCSKEESLVNKFLKISQNNIRLDNDTNMVTAKPKIVIKSRNWCTVCKRNFLSQKALNKHFLSYMHKVNAGELKMFKKFVCDVCDNSFNKMICLQRHVSSHHNEFAHKCNLCDYRTSEKCNLTEHMRRHYQIRNFACEFCDARFIAKRELKDHVAFKHNTLRPFECCDCGKLFKTKRILRRHAKTHSEFRPYVCACGSNFLRMTNLRRHHLSVHHESNPIITKIQVADDAVDSDQLKDYWYADSKYIKTKKATPLTLSQPIGIDDRIPSKDIVEPLKIENVRTLKSNMQILNVNYIMNLSNDTEKDTKMYWSVNQNFLDQSDGTDKYIHSTNQMIDTSPLNGIICKDPNVIEDTMNICDLVSSPSYPLLVSADQSDDATVNNKLTYDIALKSENISKYQMDSIMMEPDNRNNIDGIWRPIDTIDQDANIMDDQSSSSMVSNAMDIFPQNPGLISSFNEVFLTAVSNNGYADDNVQWNGLSLSNQNNYSADNSTYIYAGTVSACEPLCDSMPVSDTTSTSADNFLYYNNQPPPQQQQQQQQQHVDHTLNSHQSFAYIESYSSNVDHNYGGSVNDNFPGSFCPGLGNHHSYQTSAHNTNSHMQDLFSLSYSSTANSDFVQIPPNNSSISNILFNQEQLFHNSSNMGHHNQSSWLHGPHSPLNDFSSNDNLPPLSLDSFKLSSQTAQSSSLSNAVSSISANHPLRVLSPIDFFVSDNVFSGGLKHEYCLSLQEMPSNDSSLISDYCSQTHPFSHNSAQLCSKNFSVVNLISTANVSKEADDSDLLYSGPDESVI